MQCIEKWRRRRRRGPGTHAPIHRTYSNIFLAPCYRCILFIEWFFIFNSVFITAVIFIFTLKILLISSQEVRLWVLIYLLLFFSHQVEIIFIYLWVPICDVISNLQSWDKVYERISPIFWKECKELKRAVSSFIFFLLDEGKDNCALTCLFCLSIILQSLWSVRDL